MERVLPPLYATKKAIAFPRFHFPTFKFNGCICDRRHHLELALTASANVVHNSLIPNFRDSVHTCLEPEKANIWFNCATNKDC